MHKQGCVLAFWLCTLRIFGYFAILRCFSFLWDFVYVYSHIVYSQSSTVSAFFSFSLWTPAVCDSSSLTKCSQIYKGKYSQMCTNKYSRNVVNVVCGILLTTKSVVKCVQTNILNVAHFDYQKCSQMCTNKCSNCCAFWPLKVYPKVYTFWLPKM